MSKLVKASLTILCFPGFLAFALADDQSAQPSSPPATAQQPPTKREECRLAAKQQGLMAQQASDQIQICMAQARLDCTKAAVGSNIPNAQRRDFIRTCINGDR